MEIISPLQKNPDIKQFEEELQKGKVLERVFRTPPPQEMLSQIGTFGTTVGGSEWRQLIENYFKLLCNEYEIPLTSEELIFNPVITDRHWEPEDARKETLHLMKDAVILFGIERKYKSVGSMSELGFLATISLLTGKKTIAYLPEYKSQSDGDQDIVRAREMTTIDANYIEKSIPSHFIIFPTLLEASKTAFRERLQFLGRLASPIILESMNKILPRQDIVNRVCLSGSSKVIDTRERVNLKKFMLDRNIDYVDTVEPGWNLETYEKKELPQKDVSLVNVVVITDKTSLGAVKDVGLSVFRAVANGSYSLIYFPEDADKKSDYSRARSLAMSHLEGIKKEYPWVNHYVKVTSSVDEMEEYIGAIDKNLNLKTK